MSLIFHWTSRSCWVWRNANYLSSFSFPLWCSTTWRWSSLLYPLSPWVSFFYIYKFHPCLVIATYSYSCLHSYVFFLVHLMLLIPTFLATDLFFVLCALHIQPRMLVSRFLCCAALYDNQIKWKSIAGYDTSSPQMFSFFPIFEETFTPTKQLISTTMHNFCYKQHHS